jgi:hypothetical protein
MKHNLSAVFISFFLLVSHVNAQGQNTDSTRNKKAMHSSGNYVNYGLTISNAPKEKKDSTRRSLHCGLSFIEHDMPLIIVDGKEIKKELVNIDPEYITEVKVLKGQEAIDAYGEKGKSGVIIYKTKMNTMQMLVLQKVSDQKNNNGIVIIDKPGWQKLGLPFFMFNDMPLTDKQYYFDIDNFDSITVLRGKQATDRYGRKAKNGAVIFTTKKTITWVTSKQIIKQMRTQRPCRGLTVQTNQQPMKDDKRIFTRHKIAYFDKEFIEEIKTVDIDGKCRVVVKLKK